MYYADSIIRPSIHQSTVLTSAMAEKGECGSPSLVSIYYLLLINSCGGINSFVAEIDRSMNRLI